MRRLLVLVSLTALAACAAPQRAPLPAPPPVTPPPAQPAPSPLAPTAPKTALEAGITAGPALAALPGWSAADAAAALATFKKSCRVVTKRVDASGLTTPADWAPACAAAAAAPDARAFFETNFTPVTVGSGSGLNTGYFEPEIAGSRTPTATAAVPIYKRPSDLIEVELGQFSDNLKGKRIRGRVSGTALIPYYERAEIEDGALAGRGLELAWAVDPYELFFLHIQGSGRLDLPDGTQMRIGYDGQNGREYVGIGKRLRERNLLAPGQATMQGIIAWLRANPEQGRQIMRENKSYIFFKELTGEGPLGALNVALTPEYSVAADPAFVPLGAPLWIDTVIPEPSGAAPAGAAAGAAGYVQTPFRRLMVAQDTGGAIKGPNRFDLFWGSGPRAAKIAGGLSWQGRTVLLLPKSAAERLLSGAPQAQP